MSRPTGIAYRIDRALRKLYLRLFHGRRDIPATVGQSCPIHDAPIRQVLEGEWALHGYREVRAALASEPAIGTRGVYDIVDPHGAMLTAEEVTHDRNAGLFRKELYRLMDLIGPELRSLVEGLIAALPVDEEFSMRRQFTDLLPKWVMIQLMGLTSADMNRMREELGDDPNAPSYRDHLPAFFDRHLQSSPDGSGRLLDQARKFIADGILTRDQAVTIITLIWEGGIETTTMSIAWIIHEMLAHPELWDDIHRSSSSRIRFIEECLRLHPPLSGLLRKAGQDTVVDGHPIRQDDMLRLSIFDANRDPSRYEFPDRISLESNTARHLTFGDGVHQCIGMGIARFEARIAVEALLPVLHRLEETGFQNMRYWHPGSPLEMDYVTDFRLILHPERGAKSDADTRKAQ
jgi:cytochrome P450